MSVATVIVTPEEMVQSVVVIDGGAHRHLFRSRRLRRGDPLRIVDGLGRAVWGEVRQVSRRSAELALGEPAPANEPIHWLEIWAGLPRPQRASWLVEKATELGVCAVRWVDMALAGRRSTEAGLRRLERVARAAVEQCGRSRVPEISGPHSWGEVLVRAEMEDARVLHPGAPGEPSALGSGRSILLVGPEGGLTSAELAELDVAGVARVGLGSRRLRVETAAVAGVALMLRAQAGCEAPGPAWPGCDEVV